MSVKLPESVRKELCFTAFYDLIKESTDTEVAESYSDSISYDKSKLLDWLNNDCESASEVKVVFGRCTQGFKDDVIRDFNEPSLTDRVKVNRLTAILVAYKDGNEEISAFDLGNIHP
jgi:hypothetical protein